MAIKNILITGDDGRHALGTRMLVFYLKDKYNLSIIETKEQQSGVGGKMHLADKMKWGEHEVDGVKAVWIDGSPVDAMELAQGYFNKPFDLIISGINLGSNIANAVLSSGTFSAAFRALIIKLAKKAIVLSWDLPYDYYYFKHNPEIDLKPYLDYPAKPAAQLANMAIKNNFWQSKILNINLPEKKTNKAKFTKPLPFITDFYYYPLNIDKRNHLVSYPNGMKEQPKNFDFDTCCIKNSYISITPCRADFLDEKAYLKLKNKAIEL